MLANVSNPHPFTILHFHIQPPQNDLGFTRIHGDSRDPKLRPSFSEIMAALRPLQKPITASQVNRSSMQGSRFQEKGQPSRFFEELKGEKS